jgi:hypothetical protein
MYDDRGGGRGAGSALLLLVGSWEQEMLFGALVDAGGAGEFLCGGGVKDRRGRSWMRRSVGERGPRPRYEWVFLYWGRGHVAAWEGGT